VVVAHLGLDHFALNPVFSTCENDHVTLGSPEKCPACGGKIACRETRVVGYVTKVNDWTEVRREWEFPQRVWMDVPEEITEEACAPAD
jgi:anaerobic ribonucleoside-triphosphate reductase